MFWDGFQWVNKEDYIANQYQQVANQQNSTEQTNGGTGNSGLDPHEQTQKKLEEARTVIVEGILLDLGLTEEDVLKLITQKLDSLGERPIGYLV